ncbi:MAG: IscS subfamily cysteine desulfurase [Ginsengibacter sp.]
MLNLPIYLDNNATTQMDEKVLEAMNPYFIKHFGNASSRSHAFGWEAQEAVDRAREQVSKLIHCEPKEIIFTSGATESCNLALKGVYEMYASKGNHIITTTIEHNAVLDSCRHIEKMGEEVTYLNVNQDGLINLKELENAITPKTILISIMYGNNETGVIQSIKEIGEIAKKNGVLFFTDATQAAGKMPLNVVDEFIDLMAFSAHKMYGPKGVGALYVRRKSPRVRLTAQLDGGGHEREMRSGTLNVPGIVGFGEACQLCRLSVESESARIKKLRDILESELLLLRGVSLNGSKENRLPNVTNLSFNNTDGDNLLIELSKDIALSSGSACSSASPEPSHVLIAMGLKEESARSSIRFSLGRFTQQTEIEYVINRVKESLLKIKSSKVFETDQ